ncbi:hypothetical protein ABK040_003389 [Willaertia magna]
MSQIPIPPPSNVICQQNNQKKKKWTTKEKKKLDISSAKAFPIDQRIDWSSIKSASISGGNTSTGVIFVEPIDNEIIVLKAGSALAGEIFGSKFAKLLGLLSPSMKLYEYLPKDLNNIEWLEIKQSLSDWAIQNNEPMVNIKVNKELDRAFFFAMEFMEGIIHLESLMQHQDDNEILHDEMILKDIGKMIILDLVLNNVDRLPLNNIWQHEGNAGNILFSNIKKKLVIIDSIQTSIVSEEGKVNYLEKVKNFIKSIRKSTIDNFNENSYINDTCNFLTENCGVSFNVEHRKFILSGVLEAIELLRQMGQYNKLIELKDEVDKLKTGQDWADVWRISVDSIDLEFIRNIIDLLIGNEGM